MAAIDTTAGLGVTVARGAPAYRRYVLSLLMLSYTFNLLDRQVLGILAEPIKLAFALADWQLGVLTGVVFALFYTALGLPIARLADRGNRPLIIAVSMAVWSAFTVASGLVQNYAQLLVARLGVGIGEAGGTAPAHSLISDYAPREKRASAIAFFSVGAPLGSLLGLALGGLVLDAYGWRAAFMMAGLPGLALAGFIAFTIREPRRLPDFDAAAPGAQTIPLKQALREIASKKSLLLITLGGGLISFVNYGQSAFYASFFFRNHGEALQSLATGLNLGMAGFLGVALGLATGVTGVVGILAGGWLTDHLARHDLRHYITVKLVASLLRIPFILGAMFADNVLLALVLLSGQMLFMGVAGPGGFAAVQGLVQPRTRATASACYSFSLNLIGLGLGPLMIGALSDSLAASLGAPDGLRWAIVLSSAVLVVASLALWPARRWFKEDTVS
ncbi:MFS transporter [Phenylobacterium sp.]|uniref:spinster family MFS transporter n=1 Tax=Phenylobacterium sp. TaxID=1871053 RepID=UPI0025D9D2BA|nr:MFS transporter [Phenylobacterium sp.]